MKTQAHQHWVNTSVEAAGNFPQYDEGQVKFELGFGGWIIPAI